MTQISNSLKNIWLNKSYFLVCFILKKWAIRSFPHFWWAMWANSSGSSPKWSMWANRSGRTPQMRDHERFAQVAHQKWANERITHFFERIAHSLIFSQKTNDSLRKPMSEFPSLVLYNYFLVYLVSINENYRVSYICFCIYSKLKSTSILNITFFALNFEFVYLYTYTFSLNPLGTVYKENWMCKEK